MEYEAAIAKSWLELEGVAKEKRYSLRLLADKYEVDTEKKSVFSASCNIPAPPHATILILHYLKQKLIGLAPIRAKWIAFQELLGGQGYYPTFKKRVIDRIKRKYGERPDTLLGLVEKFKAERTQLADVSVVLEVFDNVPVLIQLWRADEEFGPSADVLFDESIAKIFCTEDVVVLSEFIVSSI